jgi:hypothetical protein
VRFVASILTAVLTGLLVVGCFWWLPRQPLRHRLLPGFLAVGVGLGVSSCFFFLWLLLAGGPDLFPLTESALLLVLGAVAAGMRARRGSDRADPIPDVPGSPASVLRWLAAALWITAICAAVAFAVEAAIRPQGAWDAWMTWNMHARALFRAGQRWRELLLALPEWSHPDYPLLLPASVARIWTYGGAETLLGPIAIAFLFTFATAGVLYASVSILRGRSQAMLAVLLLLASKFFILHGTSQYADIPLAFFFLSTLVLMSLQEVWADARDRLLALSGVTAGLAAWTKNEGVLFCIIAIGTYAYATVRARGWRSALRESRAFAFGIVPVLSLVVWFKIRLAPPNDLFPGAEPGAILARFADAGRYREILAGFGSAILEIGARGVLPLLLIVYLMIAGLAPRTSTRRAAWIPAVVVVLMLVGYATVLLAVPAPLLDTNVRSINRLLLQLLPSALLACFLWARTAEEAGGARGAQGTDADRSYAVSP